MHGQPLASPGLYGNCVKTLPTGHKFECWQMVVDDYDDENVAVLKYEVF